MHTNRPIPWEEIFEDWEKKPRVVRYSRYFKYLPMRVQDYLLFQTEERKSRLVGIKDCSKVFFTKLHVVLENEDWLSKTLMNLMAYYKRNK